MVTKLRPLGWAPWQFDLCPDKKRNLDTQGDTRGMQTHRKDNVRTQ